MSKIVLRWRKVSAGLKGGMLTLWKSNGCGGGAACSVIKVIHTFTDSFVADFLRFLTFGPLRQG